MCPHYCHFEVIHVRYKKQPLRTISLQLSMTTKCFIQGICLIENWQKPYTTSHIRLNVIFFLNLLYDALFFPLFNEYVWKRYILTIKLLMKAIYVILILSSICKTHYNCLINLAEYVIINFVVVYCTDLCFWTIVFRIELQRCL